MSIITLPAGVRDMTALMALGRVHGLAPHPLTAVCVVKHLSGPDSVWIDLGYPLVDYTPLWRAVHPTAPMPIGYRVAPLVSRDEAQRRGFSFIRLGLVGLSPRAARADGGYVLTGVSHSATDSW
jgi:hypothetical protein